MAACLPRQFPTMKCVFHIGHNVQGSNYFIGNLIYLVCFGDQGSVKIVCSTLSYDER